jgi:hypothetical protein
MKGILEGRVGRDDSCEKRNYVRRKKNMVSRYDIDVSYGLVMLYRKQAKQMCVCMCECAMNYEQQHGVRMNAWGKQCGGCRRGFDEHEKCG